MEVECPARSSCLGLLGSVLHSQWRELFGSRSCFVQQERVVWVSELFRPARSSCLGLGASAGSFVQSAMVDVCSARRSCFVQLCSPVCPASLVVECSCVSGVGLKSGLLGYVAQVVEVSTSKTGKHGHAKCHFVGIDIFNGKKLEDIVPSSHNCDVPHVARTDYQLIDISEDGFVSLLTENGNTKDDLRLPADENLLTQIKDGFGEGKDLVVTVMTAMGEEQICALKDIGPK